MKTWTKIISLLTLVSLLAACSDLRKNDVVSKPIESRQFNAGCELLVDEFKNIFEKRIKGQIDCLERNIDLFMRVVESPRPGFLSRTAFEQYIVRNVPDFPAENVRAIKSVFEKSIYSFILAKTSLSIFSIFADFELTSLSCPNISGDKICNTT
jgi:hypothetical protein